VGHSASAEKEGARPAKIAGGVPANMSQVPMTDRTECRYCRRDLASPEERLDHEASCFWEFMQ